MTLTLHGMVLSRDGLSLQRDLRGRSRAWATPPAELRTRQPRSRVNVEHGRTVGRVLDLERTESGVWAVCEVDGAPPILYGSWPVYFSAETDSLRPAPGSPDHTDVRLTGLGLVRRSATVGLAPITIYEGDLACRGGWVVPPHVKARLERAAGQRHGTGELVISDPPPKFERNSSGVAFVDGRPVGPLRYSRPYRGILRVT